jgi:hypothetical protein
MVKLYEYAGTDGVQSETVKASIIWLEQSTRTGSVSDPPCKPGLC